MAQGPGELDKYLDAQDWAPDVIDADVIDVPLVDEVLDAELTLED